MQVECAWGLQATNVIAGSNVAKLHPWKLRENENIYAPHIKLLNQPRVDHDRLYKELFQTFFADFIVLFFPKVYELMDLDNMKFLAQDVFTDVVQGERRSIDILAETRLKGEKVAVIIHVENQSYHEDRFHERMFIYFSRLYIDVGFCPSRYLAIGIIRKNPTDFQYRFLFKKFFHFHSTRFS